MSDRTCRGARWPLRRSVVGVVIALGVLASVATSGYAVETVRTDEPRIPVTDLDVAIVRAFRACELTSLSDYAESESLIIEVGTGLERPTDGVSIPVTLRVQQTSHQTTGVLDGTTTGLRQRLAVPYEEARNWGDCSPWFEVEIGPASGAPDRGNISMELSVTAEMNAGGFLIWPWEDDTVLDLEARR